MKLNDFSGASDTGILIPSNESGINQSRLEAIQWLALVLMIFDHVGAFVFPNHEWMRIVGRFSFPLFALVFSCRVAKSLRRDENKDFSPMLLKLFISGFLAHLAFLVITMSWGLQEVNIMFSFVTTLMILSMCLEGNNASGIPWGYRIMAASCVLFFSSNKIDYNAWGILLMLSLFSYFRWKDSLSLVFSFLMLVVLSAQNDQPYAYLAAPVAFFLLKIPTGWMEAKKPYPNIFYWLYPSHLFLIIVYAIASIIHSKNA